MINTSNYKEFNSNKYNTYSISGDRGKDANYFGKCYPKLAPKLEFWRKWKNNRGIISEEENTKYYIREYWNQVLSKLNPSEVYSELNDSILLCYENNNDFCHRHIVAAWFELFLGINVPEVRVKNNLIEKVERPEYIKEYLEEVIKSNKDMRGFNSIQALYLFEEGEKFERDLDKFNKGTDDWYDYKLASYVLKENAANIEAEYNSSKKKAYIKSKKD